MTPALRLVPTTEERCSWCGGFAGTHDPKCYVPAALAARLLTAEVAALAARVAERRNGEVPAMKVAQVVTSAEEALQRLQDAMKPRGVYYTVESMIVTDPQGVVSSGHWTLYVNGKRLLYLLLKRHD